MDFDPQSRIRLSESHTILPFDCGNQDLNNFLFEDAKSYLKDLMHVTYLLEFENKTLGYYSLLNDKISIEQCGTKNKWKTKFFFTRPEGFRYESYPAVKIGRLAISEQFQRNGIGKALLDFLKLDFVLNNKTGCKYITVDAYSQSIDFYKKNGFLCFTDEDKNDTTRAMYFNLDSIAQGL